MMSNSGMELVVETPLSFRFIEKLFPAPDDPLERLATLSARLGNDPSKQCRYPVEVSTKYAVFHLLNVPGRYRYPHFTISIFGTLNGKFESVRSSDQS